MLNAHISADSPLLNAALGAAMVDNDWTKRTVIKEYPHVLGSTGHQHQRLPYKVACLPLPTKANSLQIADLHALQTPHFPYHMNKTTRLEVERHYMLSRKPTLHIPRNHLTTTAFLKMPPSLPAAQHNYRRPHLHMFKVPTALRTCPRLYGGG